MSRSPQEPPSEAAWPDPSALTCLRQFNNTTDDDDSTNPEGCPRCARPCSERAARLDAHDPSHVGNKDSWGVLLTRPPVCDTAAPDPKSASLRILNLAPYAALNRGAESADCSRTIARPGAGPVVTLLPLVCKPVSSAAPRFCSWTPSALQPGPPQTGCKTWVRGRREKEPCWHRSQAGSPSHPSEGAPWGVTEPRSQSHAPLAIGIWSPQMTMTTMMVIPSVDHTLV